MAASKAKAKKVVKKMIECPDCQEQRALPPFKNPEFVGRCFDFEGVACNTERQACLRTIAGYFQGLYTKKNWWTRLYIAASAQHATASTWARFGLPLETRFARGRVMSEAVILIR